MKESQQLNIYLPSLVPLETNLFVCKIEIEKAASLQLQSHLLNLYCSAWNLSLKN